MFKVAVIFTVRGACLQGQLRGLNALAEAHGWYLQPFDNGGTMQRNVLEFAPDAFVIGTNDWVTPPALIGRPHIGLERDLTPRGWPSVLVDHAAVGRAAAADLLAKGYRHFAGFEYLLSGLPFAAQRLAAFEAAVLDAGGTYTPSSHSWMSPVPASLDNFLATRIVAWLHALPRPVGVLAACDPWGVDLLRYCREAQLRVPEQIAVMGVDNDEFQCSLAHPMLSSVAIPWERLGQEAGLLVDRLLRGLPVPAEPIRIAPTHVVTRLSSDQLAVADADVAAALAFIRAHADQAIRVTDILRNVLVFRRKLERGFRRHLHRGIAQEIRRVHIEQAKRLLATTDWPIQEIAHRSGMHVSKLPAAFRRETGLTPKAYRQKFRRP